MKLILSINLFAIILILFYILNIQSQRFLSENDPRLQIHEFNHNGNQFIASNYPMMQDENDQIRFLELKRKHKSKFHLHKKISRKNKKFYNNSENLKKFQHRLKFMSRWGKEINQAEDKNYCIQNSNNNQKDQLTRIKQFVEGPCYPVVLIPGMMGSRLRVTFDCENLDPDITNFCKLGSKQKCKKNSNFNIWFSFTGKVGLFTKNIKSSCFGQIMKLSIEQLEQKKEGDRQKNFYKGVNVDWDKNNDFANTECGLSGISNLGGGKFHNFISGALIGFKYMADYLKKMGYTPGINLFGLPYDWRQRTGINQVGEKLPAIIKFGSNLNQKKVIIVAHSFGNLNSLFVFNKMSQAEKDKMIERFVAITPPFNGIFAYMKHMLGANDDYSLKYRGYGMPDFRQIYTSSGGFLSIVNREYKYQKNSAGQWEDWSTAIQNRLRAEENFKNKLIQNNETNEWDLKNDPFPWFPHPNKNVLCSQGKFACGLNFYNYYQRPLAVIEKKIYNALGEENSILQLLIDNGVRYKSYLQGQSFENTQQHTQRMQKLWEYVNKDEIQKSENPKIPITLVYTGHLKTPASLNSPKNFFDQINSGEGYDFYPQIENFINSEGDGTVTTDSALTSVLKWAYEFDHQNTNNSQIYPMHVVEYCSKIKIILPNKKYKKFIFGHRNYYHRLNYLGFPKNTYSGLPCSDSKPKGHSDIISDEYLIKFVASIVSSGDSKQQRQLQDITQNPEIQQLQKDCPALNENDISSLKSKDLYLKILNRQDIKPDGRKNNANVAEIIDPDLVNVNGSLKFQRPLDKIEEYKNISDSYKNYMKQTDQQKAKLF